MVRVVRAPPTGRPKLLTDVMDQSAGPMRGPKLAVCMARTSPNTCQKIPANVLADAFEPFFPSNATPHTYVDAFTCLNSGKPVIKAGCGLRESGPPPPRTPTTLSHSETHLELASFSIYPSCLAQYLLPPRPTIPLYHPDLPPHTLSDLRRSTRVSVAEYLHM